MIMVPIKEALTFDDVTLMPKYSEILPSEVDTSIKLTNYLKLDIPLLSSAMDTVTESKMAIAIAKMGGIGIIHRNLEIKKQILEIKKVKKQKLLVGAAVGAGPSELKRAESILREKTDMIVVASGGTQYTGITTTQWEQSQNMKQERSQQSERASGTHQMRMT